ncbi:MAG: YicC family protein [Nitrospira sp.]|nr:YicC family protein [Nitrospira sp.]
MLKSMTGFGKREGTCHGLAVDVEVRSVNHRFREIIVRVPKGGLEWEEELKALVARKCRRGRIELVVAYGRGHDRGKHVTLDRPLARHYHRVLEDLRRDLRLGGQIDIGLLASFREIFRVAEAPIDDKRMNRVVMRLASRALADLDRMRSNEGKALQVDVAKRLKAVLEIHQSIQRRLPLVVKGFHERMRARVQALVGSTGEQEMRLDRELALFADRCDVTEELIRFRSHGVQFEEMLKKREPVGRQLDFLLQEMGREVNTIGSKANDADISKHVIQLKSELEKVREQVQNVE